jgi:hypothetical protein
LSEIYRSGNYNFLYAALVKSQNAHAMDWVVSQYNTYWVPTCYFDGGDEVFVGGYTDTAEYANRIRSSGQREVADIDLDVAMTWLGDYRMEVTVTITNNNFVNYAPDGPAAPTVPVAGLTKENVTVEVVANDSDGDDVYYKVDWDGEVGDWVGPYPTGQPVQLSHSWNAVGEYSIMVQAKDVYDSISVWSDVSDPIIIVDRGDANGDNDINVADAVKMINYVFNQGEPPVPESAGDANCDGQPNVGDAVYLINYVFNSGPAPGCPD